MIRVFVGCAPNHDDAESQAVLEHSLRSRCSEEVELTWMKLSRDPASPFYSDGPHGWQTQRWATPFSGFRWAVPALCGFRGRAIYADSDTIWLADAAELDRQKFAPGKVVLAKGGDEGWRYCVSLWDCERAQQYAPPADRLRADPDAHRKMVNFYRSHPGLVQPFRGNWNVIDGEDYVSLDDPDVKVVHYSSEAHQPQLRHAVPRLARTTGRPHWFDGEVKPHWRKDVQELFDRELAAAERGGYSVERYCQDPTFGKVAKASQKNYRSNRWGQAANA